MFGWEHFHASPYQCTWSAKLKIKRPSFVRSEVHLFCGNWKQKVEHIKKWWNRFDWWYLLFDCHLKFHIFGNFPPVCLPLAHLQFDFRFTIHLLCILFRFNRYRHGNRIRWKYGRSLCGPSVSLNKTLWFFVRSALSSFSIKKQYIKRAALFITHVRWAECLYRILLGRNVLGSVILWIPHKAHGKNTCSSRGPSPCCNLLMHAYNWKKTIDGRASRGHFLNDRKSPCKSKVKTFQHETKPIQANQMVCV